ncbi:MAG: mRNA surveillance protein pelota [Candidatus Micrarchaeia archaeon]
MQVLKQDKKTGEAKLLPQTTEDLWHIERILSPGDKIVSKTWRRFKVPGSDEAGEKKLVTMELEVEKCEFSAYVNRLRITGKIISGTPVEFVQAGSYHTIDVEAGFPVSVIKTGWKQHQVDRIAQAVRDTKKPKVAICVLDESRAVFAHVRGFGITVDYELEANMSKRDDDFDAKEKQFFADIAKKLESLETEKIIVAGPGFAKDNVKKYISQKNPALLKRLVFDSVSNATKSGVIELLKKGAISKIVQSEQIEQELMLVEKLKENIGRDTGLVAWGVKQVEQAVGYKAAEHVLVLDELLRTNKQVEDITESAYKRKTKVTVFSATSEGGAELAAFGGFACFLKFKIE